jgi:rfaE bifunctional protein nucleotidyltransferase chain/domain
MIFENFEQIKKFRAKNKKKIGLCHGVFDIIHKGHIEHFKESKKKCDILVVSVTDDKYVNKGPLQPFNTSLARAKVLEELKVVDYIYINKDVTPINLIKLLKPHFYFKGKDYSKLDFTGNLQKEIREVKKFKGKTIITKTKLLSSTKILNNSFLPWNEKQKKFLINFNKNNQLNNILKCFDLLKNLEINLIGDPILDSYVYSEIIGLTTKDPALSGLIQKKETIAGGVVSVAQIASEFVKKVRLFTYGKNYHIKSFLNEKIELINLDPSKDVQKKTRFINSYRYQKILQLTNFKKNIFSASRQVSIKKIISKKINSNLIICDFGIGILEDQVLDFVNKLKINKYINVQTNSINFGSNLITKYQKNKYLKYVSVDEREWLLAFGDTDNFDRIYKKNFLNKNTTISKTLGKNGSIYYDSGNQYQTPVFVDKTIDTTGSGDAYFILTSILKIIKTKPDLIPFLGNVYAGLHTLNLANKNYPTKTNYIKSIKSLLNF